MTQEQVAGLVRTGLAFLGGFLAENLGGIDNWQGLTATIGAALVGVWSFVSKAKK